jgi:hypothetical protein
MQSYLMQFKAFHGHQYLGEDRSQYRRSFMLNQSFGRTNSRLRPKRPRSNRTKCIFDGMLSLRLMGTQSDVKDAMQHGLDNGL